MIQTRSFMGGSAYIGGIFQALAFDGNYLYTVNNMSTSDATGSEPSNGDSGSTSVLFALDPLTLDIIWERQLPAWVWAPMTLVNGMGFVGPETHLEAVDLSDGTKLWDVQAKGTFIGAPVVNNGRVYVASGLSYYFGHPDDKLHVYALPDDPATGKKYDAAPPGPQLSDVRERLQLRHRQELHRRAVPRLLGARKPRHVGRDRGVHEPGERSSRRHLSGTGRQHDEQLRLRRERGNARRTRQA